MDIFTLFLNNDFLDKPVWLWGVFLLVVLALIIFDLGVLHRKTHEIGITESLWMSLFYIVIGLSFGGWVWFDLGPAKGMEYLTGYVVEKTLSMDNIFVMVMIFNYFAIPPLYQHRVLLFGVMEVMILRGIMIGLGAALVTQFHWILYIFAVFLIGTGIKMLLLAEHGARDIGDNPVLKFLMRHLPTTNQLHGQRFFVRLPDSKTGKLRTFLTPLMVALLMIEMADVVFAVDSIPAIFAITTDPYIVYTSNIFAVLGLRALYFALAAMITRFAYLKYALAVVLIFIGSKVFISDFSGIEKFPPALSLGITVAILGAGFAYSLWKTRKD